MFRLLLGLGCLIPVFCADWSPQLAAGYLDQRQKEWFAWTPALASGAPCVSCHTGLPYLLARPALRKMLGTTGPTEYETGLLDSLKRQRTIKSTQAAGVEAVLAALMVTTADPSSAAARQALDHMWALQIRGGKDAGAFDWFSLELDPWEMPDSRFFGASLAAMAVSSAPADYRNQAEVRAHVHSLAGYLKDARRDQPLHNRMMLLWASSRMPDLLTRTERRELLDEIWRRQQADGAWSLDGLGPWNPHAAAATASGGNAYATALATFMLKQSGVERKDRRMARAIEWLKVHQDPESGAWGAESMNKRYEAGSMQSQFMRDAATSFAVLALAGSE